MEWDIFISHSSEDKDQLVGPLARELKNRGLNVWYDEFTLLPGDSLRRSIDYGLAHSRMGVLILSLSFFNREWPQKEVDGLVALKRHLIPVWHRITQHQVAYHSPTIADLIAIDSDVGISALASQIHRFVRKFDRTKPAIHAPMIFIERAGVIIHDDDELQLIVNEILDRISAGIKPAFDIDFTHSCMSSLCSNELRKYDEASALLGLRAMREELSRIRQESIPSAADRKTALIYSSLLREADYYRTLLLESIAFIVNKGCSYYISDAVTVASSIRGIAEFVLHSSIHRIEEGGLGIDLYRVRPPELYTTIWLTREEAADLERNLGEPPSSVLRIRMACVAGELPLEVLIRKAVPAIVVETFKRRGKVETYEPNNEYADVGQWFIGLH